MREKLALAEMRRTASLVASFHTMYEKPDWETTSQYVSLVLSLYSAREESEYLELFFIKIIDEKGRTGVFKINHSLAKKYGIKVLDRWADTQQDGNSRQSEDSSVFKEAVPMMETIIMPVYVNGVDRGTIEMGYLVRTLAAREKDNLIKNALMLAGLCLIGVVIAAVMAGHFTRPIRIVVRAMKRVATGNFEAKVSYNTGDETGDLIEGFNSMVENLRNSRREIEKKTRELSESELKYRSLFQYASDGILLLDGKGVCQDANIAAERLFNLPVSQLVNAGFLDLVRPNSGETDFADCPERWEGIINVPGARPCQVEAHLASIEKNRIIAVLRDITPWKDAEEMVHRAKRRQHKMLRGLPVGILTMDEKLGFTGCNLYMEQLLGILDLTVERYSWDDFKGKFDDSRLDEKFRKVFEEGRELGVNELKYFKDEDDTRILNLRVQLFIDEPGQPGSLLLVADDTTEKSEIMRINEEYQRRLMQSQKLEARGDCP